MKKRFILGSSDDKTCDHGFRFGQKKKFTFLNRQWQTYSNFENAKLL